MLKKSLSDIENAFFNHAANAGVIFTNRPIADGLLHREHVKGDRSGTKNGAYTLHPDGNPSGWFKHFKTGITGKWTLSGKQEPINKGILQQIKKNHQQRQVEQQKRHDGAAEKSRIIWQSAEPIFDQSQHPYLVKKHIQAHQLRLYGNALVIPIYNENEQIVNLQFINADGTKRFLSGGKKKACFSVIGKPDSGSLILISEGWATGVSLHEFTGYYVVVAMDAGNLQPVALVVRRLYPSAQIIIAGDNDESGVGQKAAKAASLAIGGKYILPPVVGQDWNDALNMEVAQ
ncbi:MAG: toprim domain-containing protein [Methylobacter sp.]